MDDTRLTGYLFHQHSSPLGFLDLTTSPSDHRTAWMDLSWTSALGYNPVLIQRPQARRLQINDPRTTSRYNLYLTQFIRKHKLQEKSTQLQNNISFPLPIAIGKDLDTIDKLLTQGKIAAERRCRKLHMGQKAYSPSLSKASKSAILWGKIIQKINRKKIKHSTIRKLMEITGIQIDISSLTLEQAQHHKGQATRQYKTISRTATQLRSTWLATLAQVRAEDKNVSYEHELMQMIEKEKNRDAHRRIRACLHNTRGEALMEVTTQRDTQSHTITTQAEYRAQ